MNENFPKLIAWYLDLDKHEKQLSPHTIKAYNIDLKQFFPLSLAEQWRKNYLVNILSI